MSFSLLNIDNFLEITEGWRQQNCQDFIFKFYACKLLFLQSFFTGFLFLLRETARRKLQNSYLDLLLLSDLMLYLILVHLSSSKAQICLVNNAPVCYFAFLKRFFIPYMFCFPQLLPSIFYNIE